MLTGTDEEDGVAGYTGMGVCGREMVRSSGRSSLERRERTSGERDREREDVLLEESYRSCGLGGTNVVAILSAIFILLVEG